MLCVRALFLRRNTFEKGEKKDTAYMRDAAYIRDTVSRGYAPDLPHLLVER